MKKPSYYIGADLGTSSLKLLLVDGEGKILRCVYRGYPVSYPQPGFSEQDPGLFRDAFFSGVPELLSGFDRTAVAGVGIAGQMHGLVILDREDRPIRPVILWNDGRTAAETERLNGEFGRGKLARLTGNIAFAGFTAPKLLWLREHEPENFSRIEKIMLPKDYLTYLLTGVHATDPSDASGTLLYDVAKRRWSGEMIDYCGIREEMLPKVYESYETVGGVRREIADLLGIPEGTPVVGGAGDNAAAAVGMGVVREGLCNISLGTSGTVFLPLSRFAADPTGALHAFADATGGFHLMGCILSAASCQSWFCESVLGHTDFAAEAAAVPEDLIGRNPVFFLPYLMGERSPINDTSARGVFLGMTPKTGRSHLYLSVLEGVAFAIRDNIEVARRLGVCPDESFLCGGGARSALWRRILAAVLNMPMLLPAAEEGPGYGAAMLAMVGAGAYRTVADCAARVASLRAKVLPEEGLVRLYEERYQKYRLIYPALKELYPKLL